MTIGDRCILEDLADDGCRLSRDEQRALRLALKNKEPKVPGKNRREWERRISALNAEIAGLRNQLEFCTATAQAAGSG